ncbi:MAG TPA: ATP-binding protein [Rhabdochlamydiaceae bacterium]|jgi:two-component system phosphate regulon sensor histidine kinase PhoR|nr:ATP-binding protein [Rhabdochlamydiaceae bacterium]
MLNKESIRKKIAVFRILILMVFFVFLFPFSQTILQKLVYHAMKQSAEAVIENLQLKADEEAMIAYLGYHEFGTFFYIQLINEQLKTSYDSRQFDYPSSYTMDPHEREDALEAFKSGTVFRQAATPDSWTYFAKRFYIHQQPYVLLTSLTGMQTALWTGYFRAALLIVLAVFMLLYSVILWWGVSRLFRPFLEIMHAIRPYAMSKTDVLTPIPIQRGMVAECKHLAVTINSLLEKVKDSTRGFAEERNEKEAILETLIEGVVTIDAAGIVRFVNHTAAHLFGIPRRQMIGKSFMPPENHPKIDFFRSCQAISKLAFEKGNVVSDSVSIGDVPKVYLDLIAVPKPHRAGTIVVLQDRSSQQKVVEMGKDFIANASHELRTPITIIKGFAETLQDLPSVSMTMLTEITEKIVRNCQRMDTLVKNLLTLSDIEYVPESKFSPCDVVALADNCRHLLLTLSPTTRLDIEKSHDQMMIEADPDLLELALMNLLENGVKYSNPPAHLTIYLKQQGDEVLFAVQDRGIGIPPADVGHVFERFYTVNKAHTRRLGGAGLGLSIVKTIIEKHEGTISVASVLNQGTTFTFNIPMHRKSLVTV